LTVASPQNCRGTAFPAASLTAPTTASAIPGGGPTIGAPCPRVSRTRTRETTPTFDARA
jgi:hypothetical protein